MTPAEERRISEFTVNRLMSQKYVIETKAILDLEPKLMELIYVSETGALIFGRPRIGKTHAISHLMSTISEAYGPDFPVLKWNITDHIPTERAFYADLLMSLGCASPTKGSTSMVLKERVLNEMVILGHKTPYKKIILLIDEAWLLSVRDFQWLMDLYNRLSDHCITLITFLFGTKELLELKKHLQINHKEQIVQRFMLNEFSMCGMKDPSEMLVCLMDLDEQLMESTDRILVRDFYFPDSKRDGHRFSDLANDFFQSFATLRLQHGIVEEDIPMKFFMKAFTFLLIRYGRLSSNPIGFPTYEQVLECVKSSQYSQSSEQSEKSA